MKYCLGIDIGGTKCAVILGSCGCGGETDRGGVVRIISREAFFTGEYKDPMKAIEKMCALIDGTLKEHAIEIDEIAGIGVSCGGPLDSRAGVIMSPPNLLGWDNVPVTKILRERYGIPVRLENDANACAVAEWRYGAARGFSNIVFLTFGTGFGAGIILDGRLYRGTNDMAGEVGHIRFSENGPVGYGKAGSLEGFCSGGGIAQLARMKILERLQRGEKPDLCKDIDGLGKITAKHVGDAADRGDSLALEIYELSGEYLGKGLSVIIDILNPEVIVIGSIFQRSGHLLWPAAKRVIERETLSLARKVCRVVPSKLGDSIGDYAALSLALPEECR